MNRPKYDAMAAALAVISYRLNAVAENYGSLNSMDAPFRELQQQAAAAIAMPEDPNADAAPAPIVLAAMTADQLDAAVAKLTSTSAGIVTAVADEIHKSDAEVIAAVVATGHDTVTALTPAGAAQ